MAEGYLQIKPLGPATVNGLLDPIEIFELNGAGQARTRLQAAALRGLTRFVGRDAEVEHLRRILTRPMRAAASWSPSSAKPEWASHGSPTNSPTRTGCKTG